MKERIKVNPKRLLLLALVLLAVGLLADICEHVQDTEVIKRRDAGSQPETYQYYLEVPELGEGIPYEIKVDAKSYTSEERDRVLEEAMIEQQRRMLGDNETFDEISEPLCLVESLCHGQVKATYEISPADVVTKDGMIRMERIPKEGLDILVEVKLALADAAEGDAVQYYEIPITIIQKEPQILQVLKQELEQYLSESDRSEDALKLPTELKGYSLKWKKQYHFYGLKIIALEVIVGILLLLLQEEKKKEKKEQYQHRLRMDYPEVLGLFSVLLGAGMTIPQALQKLVEQRASSEKEREMHPIYQELSRTLWEIKEGESERKAFEELAERVGLQEYRRWIRLMMQQKREGGGRFVEEITYEAQQAYLNQRNYVKKMGEEAGTKMLLPMMGLLCIVFGIVMVPALLSFRI